MLLITRIKKKPEVRREELIDATFDLFCTVGYKKTMITDIVKKVGVASGTFYYYFPSKEAILYEIFNRAITQMLTTFRTEIYQLSALHKLQLCIKKFFLPHPVGAVIDKLKEENQFELISKIWNRIQGIFNPLLIEIFKQGNQEKTMHVIYLNETIPFFWSILNCLLAAAPPNKDPQIFAKKLFITSSALERILGIKEGLFDLSII